MTDEEIPKGGYETIVTPFEMGAGDTLIQSVIDYFDGNMKSW
ncbi:hypothetical protein ORI89_02020 [Sphingobacterium sp. UT-1RO-CII-1]|nr:hypothetical protein [Sphingobacterium sp. UT-1RO-CII-1]MCY4778411.1 hypothetical protein [Sphingobacterium sp. UT-1RO-CII-1]